MKETSEAEGVSPATVSAVWDRRSGIMGGKTEISLDVRLKAYTLFEKRTRIVRICKKLKLGADDVIGMRMEYDKMIKADHDQVLEESKEQQKRLMEDIERLERNRRETSEELAKVKSLLEDNKRKEQEARKKIDQIDRSLKAKKRYFLGVLEELEPRHTDLCQLLLILYESEYFNLALMKPLVRGTITALKKRPDNEAIMSRINFGRAAPPAGRPDPALQLETFVERYIEADLKDREEHEIPEMPLEE